MKYVSTRGEAPELDFEGVLLAGLAVDGGLYVPKVWPRFLPEAIAAFAGQPFHAVATEVISAFAGPAIDRKDIARICVDSYATFNHEAVTPLVQIGPRDWVLELFHGPTLAFKDVAMQVVSRLMDHVLAKRGGRATIVGATSGDTGGAAIEAFRGSAQVDVVILYPDGKVSDVQRRMMTTPTDPNVHAVAVAGTFDDCQARVKDMFAHPAFRERVHLSGVNSINWARIAAQVTYYFVAAAALGGPHRLVSFAVPTGNFGDIFAGYVARRMGLPIAQLVIATNSNDILVRTLASGAYETRQVLATMSPSMDIQVSSNFERYLFEAADRDAGAVRSMMASLKQGGAFQLGATAARARGEFAASSATEDEVAGAIRSVKTASGYLMDPHTACGFVAAQKALSGSAAPRVVLATAHPAKFPDAMAAIAGVRPPLPPANAGMMTANERITHIANDVHAIEQYVASVARVGNGGRS